ncbi:MAG TPA: dTMP kinase [Ignavibacteria bacterium]|nr:dTMP kinase [Ignavibacteria bacterium]
MFITFEGIDLSGKSTQAKLLYNYLKKRGRKVILVREPGGTKISEKIRDILLDKNHSGMFSLTEFLLFSASRQQLTEEVIKPHLRKGYFVICDRYYDSSTAYQGYGGQVELKTILGINKTAAGGLSPDLTFFIDIDMKESAARRKAARKSKDRMEQKKLNYFNKVIGGYRELASKENKRFKRIDGRKPVGDIQEEILNIIRKRVKNA